MKKTGCSPFFIGQELISKVGYEQTIRSVGNRTNEYETVGIIEGVSKMFL